MIRTRPVAFSGTKQESAQCSGYDDSDDHNDDDDDDDDDDVDDVDDDEHGLFGAGASPASSSVQEPRQRRRGRDAKHRVVQAQGDAQHSAEATVDVLPDDKSVPERKSAPRRHGQDGER